MNDIVSILMCVYNTPLQYFKEAVESITNQSYEPCEIILVDDGSNDTELVEFIDRIEAEYGCIQVIHNKSNYGLTRSLNIGLDHCCGKYIARMDADDVAFPYRISKQVEYLEANPEVALVGSRIIDFGDIEEKPPQLSDKCDDPDVYAIRSMLQHSGPPHPTFVFRAGHLRDHNIKYREEIRKAQDYGIMVDILKAGGVIRIINEPLLKYRVHSGQITRSSEVEQKAYQCKVSYDYVRFLFPDLSEPESAAVSMLGCSAPWDELINTINGLPDLQKVCDFVIRFQTQLTCPDTYIRAIKKILLYNSCHQLFNKGKLEAELRYEWWKKAVRMSKSRHRIWGMRLYTVLCYRYVMRQRNR